MPNRLQHESSLYLRQHANNPVDWYPWGEEALNRSQQEDKPIILSIGYSTCHWCHVMAHESFEKPETARLMNENFVSIKVDREERPDLDAIYMEAVQTLTGQGGWPLTVFLTPDLKPFHGGTYFPPVDRYGLPGFPRLLAEVAEDYRQRRQETQSLADWLTGQLQQTPLRASSQLPEADSLQLALRNLRPAFDETYGGFGEQPKFPQPAQQELLLRLHARGLDDGALSMVETTLRQMAVGGIHDQIGGGFHRYSVDRQWTVPHFEKMLYDNAQLVRLYAHAYLVTGEEDYRTVVEDTLGYLLRELRSPAGGFYAAQDADSPGGEGAFYVWTPDEVKDVLGESEGELACRYFGIDEPGNFEGKSIPTRRRQAETVAAELGIDEEELRARAGAARLALLASRDQRPRPGIDNKVLAGWNGLALSGLAEAGAAFAEEDYLKEARKLASHLLAELFTGGQLLHQVGKPERGFLQDYAFLAEGLLDLYGATLEGEWLTAARRLARGLVARFWSEPDNCFYDVEAGQQGLIVRPRSLHDNVLPSGASVATLVLLRLAAIDGDGERRRLADSALAPLARSGARGPLGFGYWLCAFDFATATPQELAIVGAPDEPGTRELLAGARGLYRPNLVLVGQEGSEDSPLLANRLGAVPALLESERRGGTAAAPTAYYCANFTCLPPTADPEELRRLLGG